MPELDYFTPSQPLTIRRWRWEYFVPFAAGGVLTLAGATSTLAMWFLQGQVGRIPLNNLPGSARYQLLIEHLPGWGGSAGLAGLALWSVWRFIRRPNPVLLILNLVVCWLAWWVLVLVIAGNSFHAFP